MSFHAAAMPSRVRSRTEDVEYELAGGRGDIEVLLEADQVDAAGLAVRSVRRGDFCWRLRKSADKWRTAEPVPVVRGAGDDSERRVGV